MSSVVTLSFEVLAKRAPEASFMQVYPGFVKTDPRRDDKSLGMRVALGVLKAVGPLLYLLDGEVGERQLFLSTSGLFPLREGDAGGVGLDAGVEPATGTDGERGSGVYSVNWKGRVQGVKGTGLLAELRGDGTDEYARSTGSYFVAKGITERV